MSQDDDSRMFGKPANLQPSLAESFPSVAVLSVKAWIGGYCGVPPKGIEREFTEANAVYTIDCPNPVCKHGGFAIRDVIRNAIARQLDTHEESLRCLGREAVNRACTNICRVKVAVTYKAE